MSHRRSAQDADSARALATGAAIDAVWAPCYIQEVAPIPFLWVLPLTVYLLTFILAFSGGRL